MIALNQLLNNPRQFDDAYNYINADVCLSPILKLSDQLKCLEKESEEKRARCNRLCADVLSVRDDPKQLEHLLSEIEELDTMAKSLKNAALSVEAEINRHLKKLHNLPDYFENSDKIMSKSQNFSTTEQFYEFLNTLSKVQPTDLSSSDFMRSLSSKMLLEDDFPIIKSDGKSITILSNEQNIEEILSKILKFLSANSLKLTQLATKKLSRCASAEFRSKLNSTTFVSVKLCREFYSREYKIKYREKQFDITKFVNEIRINVTKKR